MHSSYKERESRVQRRILRKQLVETITASKLKPAPAAEASSELRRRRRPKLAVYEGSGAGVHLAAIEV